MTNYQLRITSTVFCICAALVCSSLSIGTAIAPAIA